MEAGHSRALCVGWVADKLTRGSVDNGWDVEYMSVYSPGLNRFLDLIATWTASSEYEQGRLRKEGRL